VKLSEEMLRIGSRAATVCAVAVNAVQVQSVSEEVRDVQEKDVAEHRGVLRRAFKNRSLYLFRSPAVSSFLRRFSSEIALTLNVALLL